MLLTMIDHSTTWCEASPLPNAFAATIADALIQTWICRYGVPLKLLSDHGPQFERALVDRISSRLGIRKIHTTPYHPSSNGKVERLHRFIIPAIATFVHNAQDRWDEFIDCALFAARTTRIGPSLHSSMQLVLGITPRLPADLLYGDPSLLQFDVKNYKAEVQQHFRDSVCNANTQLSAYKQHVYDVRNQTRTHTVFNMGLSS